MKSNRMISKKPCKILCDLLLDNRIRLSDIPQKKRLDYYVYYVYAFRVDRNISRNRYIEDLQIMAEDIKQFTGFDKDNWQRMYNDKLDQLKYCVKN